MNKKINRLVSLSLLTLLLTGCDGTSVSRRQAAQVLQMIKNQQTKTTSDATYVSPLEITFESKVTTIEGTMERVIEDIYVVSYSKSLVMHEHTETLDIEIITTYTNYYFVGSDSVYYQTVYGEGFYSTWKDSYNPQTTFYAQYLSSQTTVLSLIAEIDSPDTFYNYLIDMDEDDQNTISESYHTKNSSHLKAEIIKYKSRKKDNISEKTYFTYEDSLLLEYVTADGDDNETSYVIEYSANAEVPDPLTHASEVGTPSNSENTTL